MGFRGTVPLVLHRTIRQDNWTEWKQDASEWEAPMGFRRNVLLVIHRTNGRDGVVPDKGIHRTVLPTFSGTSGVLFGTKEF